MYRTLCLLIVALATGCSLRPAVRVDVERGVSATELSFLLSATGSAQVAPVVEQLQVSTLAVGRASGSLGHVQWAVARLRGAPALRLPAAVRYGMTPAGFASSGPAPTLVNAQYEVRVLANGVWSVAQFDVTNQNTIE